MIAPRISLFAIGAGCVMILALPGCESGDSGCLLCGDFEIFDPPEIQSVRIVPDAVLLSVGQSVSLRAIVTGTDGILRDALPGWISSDTVLATVSPRTGQRTQVTGRAPGEASITASFFGKSGHAKVNVQN